jgi:hypothetical protein
MDLTFTFFQNGRERERERERDTQRERERERERERQRERERGENASLDQTRKIYWLRRGEGEKRNQKRLQDAKSRGSCNTYSIMRTLMYGTETARRGWQQRERGEEEGEREREKGRMNVGAKIKKGPFSAFLFLRFFSPLFSLW